MKKLTFFLIVLLSVVLADAQTRNDSIQVAYDKISNLETRIANQDAQIAKLLQQVDEVTRQNLALKKNLNLTPTIATAKAGDIMEYRIVEVTGDTATNTVHLVISTNNLLNEDKEIKYYAVKIIDDLGHGYNKYGQSKLKIEGASDDLIMNKVHHYTNAPYTLDMYVYDYNPESMYIKLLDLQTVDGIKDIPARFENLPIKWNK